MDSRSSKSRSLAIDDQSSSRRLELSDRHNSAPQVGKRRESQSKRVSGGAKTPETSKRSSKLSQREDAEGRVPSAKRASERPRSGSQADRKSPQAREHDEIPSLAFALLGSGGVGRSSFARNALDLRKAPETPLSASKVSLGGNVYRVQLIEISFEDVDFSSGRRVVWPKFLQGTAVPHIHGVFCLYDVTDQNSVANIPQALATLSKCETPCMLVASKSDAPEEDREVQIQFQEKVQRHFPSVVICEVSKDEPESQKRCLSNMLNRLFATPRIGSELESHRRTASEKSPFPQQSKSRDPSPSTSRSRSRSDTRLRGSRSKDLLNASCRPPVIESADEDSSGSHEGGRVMAPAPRKTKLKVDTSNVPRAKQPRPAEPHTPMSSSEDLSNNKRKSTSDPSKSAVPETPDSYYVRSMLRPSTSEVVDSKAFQSFLNMDEEAHDESKRMDLQAVNEKLKQMVLDDNTKSEPGVSFQDLVERLLVLPASKQDSKFVPSFLCLYRMFATPKQLLVAIIDQFVRTEKSNMVRFTKVAEMLRYLQVLGQWTAQYPGDFSFAPARDIAIAFVQNLEKSREFGPAAREISNNLHTHVPDDDLDWAYDDAPNSASSKGSAATNKKTPTSSSTSIPPSTNDNPLKVPLYRQAHGDSEGDSEHRYDPSSASTASSILRTGNSSQSFLNLAQLESAREEARKLHPNPCIRLSKIQWHQFMDIPNDELAKEITRIDWTMYSSIRPRDYVRLVTTSEQKNRARRHDHINVMCRQFNHLAIFVSGMILLRDKPKHRARAQEKFMGLAWKVRQMNNYNGLGAIVSGVTSSEITRLTATGALIPESTHKEFMRLTILMSHSRSHAAYRMAWDNSFQERIPFMPLVKNDLTLAANANPTMVGSNINWKKFQIMGEAIVGIQRSLEQPYSFSPRSARTEEIAKMILETRMIDETEDIVDPHEELFERSKILEPPGGVDIRKKFDWLRR